MYLSLDVSGNESLIRKGAQNLDHSFYSKFAKGQWMVNIHSFSLTFALCLSFPPRIRQAMLTAINSYQSAVVVEKTMDRMAFSDIFFK